MSGERTPKSPEVRGGGMARPEKGLLPREIAPDERTIRMQRISSLFSSFGSVLLGEGRISELEVYQKHDVHAFYRLASNPDEVVHVQGYPGMSTNRQATILARVMDYDKMQEVRRRGLKNGARLIGNEHEAVLRQDSQTEIAYQENSLSAVLNLLSTDLGMSFTRLQELGLL